MSSKTCMYCYRDANTCEKTLITVHNKKIFGQLILLEAYIDTEKKELTVAETSSSGWNKNVKIHFCPMCGRKLD